MALLFRRRDPGEPAPDPPGTPFAVDRTHTSLTIAWPEFVNDANAPHEYDYKFTSVDHEFELKYYRASARFESWHSLGVVSKNKWLKISGLEPGTGYVFQVRRRYQPNYDEDVVEVNVSDLRAGTTTTTAAAAASGPHKWSLPSESSAVVHTLIHDEQERLDNLHRLRTFIQLGNEGVVAYPEEEVVPDTLGAKATRTMEGLLLAASKAGLGGAYMSVVKNAWRIHKTGLASLLFHPDLQQTVYVLLTFLNQVSSQIGLSTRDVAVGCYFALWEAKKERLLHPLCEFQDHAEDKPGVLASKVPAVLLNELMFYLPLAGMAYRGKPSHIQWTLNKFADRNFKLVMCRQLSSKFRPSFFLAANEVTKTACFVIRGTAELDDVVTDGLCDVKKTAFHFGSDEREFFVHAGMLKAAKWLVRGNDKKRPASEALQESEEEQPMGAGVEDAVAKLWAAGYRRVVFGGHSLGGGVSTLAALLLADKFRELEIRVYAYGTPAVVDEILAEACKGVHARDANLVDGLGTRVTVKNLIRHDDLVPRLSLLSARNFAQHLKDTRSKWEPLLNEDLASFTSRIKTAWAPMQRAHSITSKGPSIRLGVTAEGEDRNNEASKEEQVQAATVAAEEEEAHAPPPADGDKMEVEEASPAQAPPPPPQPETAKQRATRELQERLERSLANPLVVPGLICHTYEHHGTHRASLVDHRFQPLRRISAFPNCVDDHKLDEIMSVARSVQFADEVRARGRFPPHWESLLDHANDAAEWQVTCRVCVYPVSWHQTSHSEAMEIRATHHCHNCGRIVCSVCSQARVSLPHLGIITPVRVCDLCKYELFTPREGGENPCDFEEY